MKRFSIFVSVAFVCISIVLGDVQLTYEDAHCRDQKVRYGFDLIPAYRAGSLSVRWYPSAGCWLEMPATNRLCKVSAFMPLRSVGVSEYSFPKRRSKGEMNKKDRRGRRFQVQYLARVVDRGIDFDTFKVFDFEGQDIFPFVSEWGSGCWASCFGDQIGDVDDVLCSSGRILLGNGVVLMYSLIVDQIGKFDFRYSLNGFGDGRCLSFEFKDGELFCGQRKLSVNAPIEISSPWVSVCLNDDDMIQLRFAYALNEIRNGSYCENAILISRKNMLGILEWMLNKDVDKGSWWAQEKSSLENNVIF